ncbi:transposase [Clostridium algidicarnis]|nr:transposase [Clostridium algidicarnis]MBU3228915.1 transposase [Clostridium algidicarnis]MBU3252459.1 transposase [Clostridium algidicarnis]
MNKSYSAEFKMESVKRVEKTGEPMSKVVADLGVKSTTTMQGWVNKYRKYPKDPFIGSGHLSPEDEKNYKLEKENRDLKQENDILKKAAAYFARNLK